MRFSSRLIPLLLVSCTSVNGFNYLQSPSFYTKNRGTSLYSQKSAEILAKARAAVGQDPVPVPDSKFDDDILEDMKNSLFFLENRVKNGPGSFSKDELIQFQAASSRIIDEMSAKYKEEQTQEPAAPKQEATPVPPAAVEPPPPPPPMPSLLQNAKSGQKEMLQKRQQEQKQLAVDTTPSPIVEEEVEEEVSNVMDTSNDEAPAYTGKGGMGLANGTTNTWNIPGMDEMTGEEYRKALQESVSQRQEERRKKLNGAIGNSAVKSYLDNL